MCPALLFNYLDTRVEQDLLMANVYPRLKAFARKNGLEFQMVSMRWYAVFILGKVTCFSWVLKSVSLI